MRLSANTAPARALLLSAGALFSRLLGLVRDLLFAFILGGGWAGDLFLAAFRLPHLARRLPRRGPSLWPSSRSSSGKTRSAAGSRPWT
ncbi:MAG: hypothetical protein FWG17_03500 [Desulfovibrionaceae bacterium]|nr:hypothetical protein [Desulfovibrionaceae bacterium]